MFKRVTNFIFDNSLPLIIGAFAGLVWANIDGSGYGAFVGTKVFSNTCVGAICENGGRVIDLRYLVNGILMALFFALAAREVWEAMLPGGPLYSPRRAAVPILSAIGGMIGPSVIYVCGAAAFGRFNELGRGWAIPCATDIAFSYVVARLIFGAGHPSVAFLLLLAIADDALGMVILAVFYPLEQVRWAWLTLLPAAIAAAMIMRRLRVHGFWWYLLGPGAVSWFGFALSGLHPALGLVPIIPFIPHACVAEGHEGWDCLALESMWSKFESWLKRPVDVILGIFGLFNAGVALREPGLATLLVFVALLAGKPIGIFVSGALTMKALGAKVTRGIALRELFVVGIAAGIGFTVSVFVTTAAFPAGHTQDTAKMGALASFLSAIFAWGAARLLGVRRAASGRRSTEPAHGPE